MNCSLEEIFKDFKKQNKTLNDTIKKLLFLIFFSFAFFSVVGREHTDIKRPHWKQVKYSFEEGEYKNKVCYFRFNHYLYASRCKIKLTNNCKITKATCEDYYTNKQIECFIENKNVCNTEHILAQAIFRNLMKRYNTLGENNENYIKAFHDEDNLVITKDKINHEKSDKIKFEAKFIDILKSEMLSKEQISKKEIETNKKGKAFCDKLANQNLFDKKECVKLYNS